MLPAIIEHPSINVGIEFSPDSKFLLCYTDGWEQDSKKQATCVVLDAETETQVARLECDSLNCVAFSALGDRLAVASRSAVTLFDTTDWVRLLDIKPPGLDPKCPDFSSVAFSDDGKSLAITSEKSPEEIILVDAATGAVLDRRRKSERDFTLVDVGFARGGSTLIALGYTYDFIGRVYAWTDSGLKTLELDNLLDQPDCYSVGAAVDEGLIAACGRDLKVFKLGDRDVGWQLVRTGTAFGEFAVDVQIAASSRILCSSGMDETSESGERNRIAVISCDVDATTEDLRWSLDGKVYCSAITDDGTSIAVVSGDADDFLDDDLPHYKVTLLNANAPTDIVTHETASRKTNALYHCPTRAKFSPDGHRLAVAHLNHVELWQIQ